MQMETGLKQDHQQLRGQLQSFVVHARENEFKMRRFHEQEMRLISTNSLSELIQIILHNYRTTFSLETVSLVLYDPDYEIQRILGDEVNDLTCENQLLFVTRRNRLLQMYGDTLATTLDYYDHARHAFLFNKTVPVLHSIALLPLIRYGELIGSLNLGSKSVERFTKDSATDFLQRLATIVAICLENATNHERLKRVGLTDSLTEINNRRFFDQRIGEEIARSIRAREPLSCLYLDIDHFKRINDQHGHQVGDQVLRETAGLIREQLRNSDVLGRYGGEEFAVLLPNTSSRSAMEIAERIRENIAVNRFKITGHSDTTGLRVTISIGVAELAANTVPTEIDTLCHRLLDSADAALFEAKHTGRNTVTLTTRNIGSPQKVSIDNPVSRSRSDLSDRSKEKPF